MSHISTKALKIEASEIRKAFDLGQSLKDPIDLSIGQPNFEVAEPIKEAAIKAINEGFNRYTMTQGIPALREKLSTKFEERFGFKPPALMVTSGVGGAIVLALLTLIDDKDEVIITDPYFPLYKHIITVAGGIPKYANTYPDFRLRKEEFEKVITKRTKAIIVSTPANPTGVVYTKPEILMLVELAKKHDLIIITDEVYRSFIYDVTLASAMKYYAKTILVDGFSKAYGVPGWRLGYAAGPKEIIERMTIIQQWSFICAPAPFQKAAITALDYNMSAQIAEFHRRRDLVYNTLKDKYELIKPDGAFYAFPKVPKGDCHDFIKKAAAHNLLIVPGTAFSEQDTHFRISYATTEDKLRKGLEILLKLAT
ncbi:MAG: aminotransferase class I/II-fold pyridoxal phosphate-dependent enzyme [Planctomycetes bacterium]|nr:aminotransferase class I/II-fold pyridoxal phosphate-dependent enzyme [Planctomycetota bacterium]